MTNEEMLNKYPFLERLMNDMLIVSTEEDNINKESPTIKCSVNGKDISITKEVLTKLLTDDRYYSYVLKLFNNEIPCFRVCGVKNGDITPSIKLSKAEIVIGLEELKKETIFTDEMNDKLSYLSSEVSFNKFFNDFKDNAYQISIDGFDIVIPLLGMINFLRLKEDYYLKCLSLDTISNTKVEYFIYALTKFIVDEHILDNYVMNEDMIDRISKLICNEVIDVESLNQITKTIDKEKDKVKVNERFHDYIMSDMEGLSLLEKSIYIYIKMCKSFTYDEEFYASGQTGLPTLKHRDINNIEKIDLTNNKIVCYEFNAIYAKFLSELGINYISITRGGNEYGTGHAYLTYRIGKYLINADSVESIIRGDLFQAKLNLPLNGLVCKNANLDTKSEFSSIVDKVYKRFIGDNTSSNISFEDIKNEYESLCSKRSIPLEERVSILINKVNGADLEGVDSLSYIIHLNNLLFTSLEKKKNMVVSLLKHNLEDDRVGVSVIFTINKSDVNKNSDENKYIYYEPKNKLIEIQKDDILKEMKDGSLSYIKGSVYKIPGTNIGDELYERKTNRNK